MSDIWRIDSEKARFEPDAVFQTPQELVHAPGLTRGQKIAALERWQLTLQDRLRSTAEGMAPPPGQTADEAAMIVEIERALEKLRGEVDASN